MLDSDTSTKPLKGLSSAGKGVVFYYRKSKLIMCVKF